MKKLNLIANFIVDVIQILNEEVQDSETQKGTKKAVEDKVKQEEEDTRDLNVISDLLKQHEKLQKTSEEDLKIMNSFLDSLANLSDDEA